MDKVKYSFKLDTSTPMEQFAYCTNNNCILDCSRRNISHIDKISICADLGLICSDYIEQDAVLIKENKE